MSKIHDFLPICGGSFFLSVQRDLIHPYRQSSNCPNVKKCHLIHLPSHLPLNLLVLPAELCPSWKRKDLAILLYVAVHERGVSAGGGLGTAPFNVFEPKKMHLLCTRKLGGTIDVIGGQAGTIRRVEGRRRDKHASEENPIQVNVLSCLKEFSDFYRIFCEPR